MRREMRRDLRRERGDLVEEVAGAPDEDARVPEIAVADHRLGARAIGLLDEPRDAARTRRPRWRRPAGCSRIPGRVAPGRRRPSPARAASRPIRAARRSAARKPSGSPTAQSAWTLIITSSRRAALRDDVRRPRERRRRARRPRLGDRCSRAAGRARAPRSASTSSAFVSTSVRSSGTSGARRASVSASIGSSSRAAAAASGDQGC